MSNDNRNIIHNHYAFQAGATGAQGSTGMGNYNWAFARDTQNFLIMDQGTLIPYPSGNRLADQSGVYGSSLVGTPGIPGITPYGGSIGDAGTVGAILAGLGDRVFGVTGTIGALAKFDTADTLGDSILSEVSSKILFSGDTVANLYRSAASTIKTDGDFLATSITVTGVADVLTLSVDRYAEISSGLTWDDTDIDESAVIISPNLTKTDGDTRTFAGLKIRPIYNTPGNSSTTFNILEIDTGIIDDDGITTNLINSMYGGSSRFKVLASGGVAITSPPGQYGLLIHSVGEVGSANQEFISVGHTGSVAFLSVNKSGTGSYRNFRILNSGTVQYELSTAGAHQFNGPVTVDPVVAGTSFAVESSGTEVFGVTHTGTLNISSVQVMTSRRTGWTSPTGTATRTGYATGSATTTQLAETLKALIDDLTTHGMIGS